MAGPTLPAEMHEAIMRHATAATLTAMALVSRAMTTMAMPHLYCNVFVATPAAGARLLETLESRADLAAYIQAWTGCIYNGCPWSISNCALLFKLHTVNILVPHLEDDDFLLFSGMEDLSGLHTINLDLHDLLREAVISLLTMIPSSVQHLGLRIHGTFKASHYVFRPTILAHLHSLTVEAQMLPDDRVYPAYLLKGFGGSSSMQQQPGLRKLCLSGIGSDGAERLIEHYGHQVQQLDIRMLVAPTDSPNFLSHMAAHLPALQHVAAHNEKILFQLCLSTSSGNIHSASIQCCSDPTYKTAQGVLQFAAEQSLRIELCKQTMEHWWKDLAVAEASVTVLFLTAMAQPFATELVDQILQYLDPKSLAHAALVSNQFQGPATHYLYQDLNIFEAQTAKLVLRTLTNHPEYARLVHIITGRLTSRSTITILTTIGLGNWTRLRILVLSIGELNNHRLAMFSSLEGIQTLEELHLHLFPGMAENRARVLLACTPPQITALVLDAPGKALLTGTAKKTAKLTRLRSLVLSGRGQTGLLRMLADADSPLHITSQLQNLSIMHGTPCEVLALLRKYGSALDYLDLSGLTIGLDPAITKSLAELVPALSHLRVSEMQVEPRLIADLPRSVHSIYFSYSMSSFIKSSFKVWREGRRLCDLATIIAVLQRHINLWLCCAKAHEDVFVHETEAYTGDWVQFHLCSPGRRRWCMCSHDTWKKSIGIFSQTRNSMQEERDNYAEALLSDKEF
uniref:F-box domain-containing protein n=1 Tax=Mycena chlorophos TaxID=658473 RepID=A0ABQ0LWQ8_MYCCL|nr:predicted protein [Mycena chlorophos]